MLGFIAVPSAQATPFSYTRLDNGVPVVGQIAATHVYNSPVGAQYYSLFAAAGSTVNVVGARLEANYDMAFWIFRGLYADTNDFGGLFSYSSPTFVTIGDDENPANIPGPYGDPNSSFFVSSSGFYTVAVANFVSGDPGPDGLYDYQLTARGIQTAQTVQNVPVPAVVALLGMGFVVLAFTRRRKQN